jgi:hypothetical protein
MVCVLINHMPCGCQGLALTRLADPKRGQNDYWIFGLIQRFYVNRIPYFYIAN